MPAALFNICIGDISFHLAFDAQRQPFVEANGISYTSLSRLYQDFPFLFNEPFLEQTAQLTTFLLKGLEFRYIEKIELFKSNYKQQIEREQKEINWSEPRLSDYGIFDVSKIHPPLIKNGKWSFFVQEGHTQLPYKVTISLPPPPKNGKIAYELLPLSK
jgi:hypothetical protein